METEIKLGLAPEHVARLKRHPLLKGSESMRQALSSTYYDTPDFALTRRRIALRLRRIGYHRVQTLKAAAPAVGALATRPEWETRIMGHSPDFAVLPDAARALLEGIDLDRLAPVFTTDIRRTTWQIRLNETEMEIALDQGTVIAGEQTLPLCEIELELKAGSVAGLFAAALALLDAVPLCIDSRSKAALGYQLAGAVTPTPVKATWPELDPEAPAAASWATLLEAALGQLVDNLPGYLEHPQDGEYLHQLRIGLRRLLSLARLTTSPPDWLADLRSIMDVLNPARDWDVFLSDTLPGLALPHDPTFLAAATQQAAQARQAAQNLLAGATFTRYILAIGRHLQTLRTDTPPTLAQPTPLWATQVLEQHWQTVQRRSRKLDQSPERRHRLRIAIKKMRYACDALAGLYGKQGRKSLRQLQTLQDDLGASNDLAVAERLMHDLARDHTRAAFTAGRVVGLLSAVQDSPRAIHADLAVLKPFWR